MVPPVEIPEHKEPPRPSNPRWWFEKVIRPNFDDFRREPKSCRLAWNLVVSLRHFPERCNWWDCYRQNINAPDRIGELGAKYFDKIINGRKDSVQLRCNQSLLEDVADTYKHHIGSRNRIRERTSTDVIFETGDGLWVCDGDGNEVKSVKALLDEMIKFWDEWLDENCPDVLQSPTR